MRALGYRVTLHRVAIFAIGGFVAGLSGVLGVWYRGNISPGVVDLARTIDVLIIAVIGGLGYPIGAFIGAFIFLVLDVFASSVEVFGFSFDERFNTLIGLAFVVIVLVAPNGVVGLVDRGWTGGRTSVLIERDTGRGRGRGGARRERHGSGGPAAGRSDRAAGPRLRGRARQLAGRTCWGTRVWEETTRVARIVRPTGHQEED